MKIIKRFFTAEFLRFVVTGIINTLSTSVFAMLLDRIPVLAQPGIQSFNVTFIIGYVLGLCVSFVLNTYFTFREKPTLKKALSFPLSYIPNFLIQYVLVYIFKLADIPSGVAYACVAVVGVPVTFIFMRTIVYRK